VTGLLVDGEPLLAGVCAESDIALPLFSSPIRPKSLPKRKRRRKSYSDSQSASAPVIAL